MKQNINEELNYMKYLLGYQKGIVISEQTTPASDTPMQPQPQDTPASEPTQGGDGCIPLTISGKFNPKKSDSTEYLTNIISQLDAQIKSKPEFQGGSITSIRIIGGASNVDNGIKSDFTLNNDYTPSGTTPKQTKEFQNNMGYAQARIDASKQPILDELKKVGLTVSVEPTTETHVIDTGGTSDSKRNSGTHPNPGQVVIIQMTICPVKDGAGREDFDKLPYLKPQLIPTTSGEIVNRIENLIECYENSEIRIFYGDPKKGHYCSKALYNVYANGIQLKRADGKDYASLNNVGDKFDNAEIINGERKKECGRGNRCGRSNTFTLDRITNESFFNKDVLYKHNGGLVITAECADKGQGSYGGNSDCHKDVGNISFKIKGLGEEVKEASDTPNMFNVPKEIGNFAACKTYKLQAAK